MKILSVGHALIDIFIPAEPQVPLDLGFTPYGYFEVDEARMDEVLAHFPDKAIMSGGSAANGSKIASALGLEVHFVGRIGNDHYGDIFRQELLDAGVNLHLESVPENTGICVTFVHDHGQRTIVTSRGASAGLKPANLPLDLFPALDLIVFEGYMLYNRETLYCLLRNGSRFKTKMAFDPGNSQVAFEQREEILAIIDSYVDYFFANEEETMVLTGLDIVNSLKSFQSHVDSFVVKRGPQGTMTLINDNPYAIAAPLIQIADPTGAGDGFTAGYLWGLDKGYNQEKRLKCGTIVAGAILQIHGTKLSEEIVARIHKELNNL